MSSSMRDNRIYDYLKLLELGDEMYECDRRIVTRTTKTVTKGPGGVLLAQTTEETIEFS